MNHDRRTFVIFLLECVLLQHFTLYLILSSPLLIGINTVVMSERFWSVQRKHVSTLCAPESFARAYFCFSCFTCRVMGLLVVAICTLDFVNGRRGQYCLQV